MYKNPIKITNDGAESDINYGDHPYMMPKKEIDMYKRGHYYWFRDVAEEEYSPAEFVGYFDGGIYRWCFFEVEVTITYKIDEFETDGEIIHV